MVHAFFSQLRVVVLIRVLSSLSPTSSRHTESSSSSPQFIGVQKVTGSSGVNVTSSGVSVDCDMDRAQVPDLQKLVSCKSHSMFPFWRPKARLIAPSGWMNDPTAIFQTKNGTFHIGYQCRPDQLTWHNISQCSASTSDFVSFNDYHSWDNPMTIAPTQLYDIAGVFDGTIIEEGWNGFPTLIYTSVSAGPQGSLIDPPEHQGIETQSIAYTEDDGETWTKLNFGHNGNPVIYLWPEEHLTGFRDPFVFESPQFYDFYADSSITHQIQGSRVPKGKKFMLISGGHRMEADPINGGPRLYLYRQTEENNVVDWSYLGPFFEVQAQYNQTSPWTGAFGVNFECGGVARLNEKGRATETGSDHNELNVVVVGAWGARNGTHLPGWPLWSAVKYDYNTTDGNIKARVEYSGAIDWGTAYAFALFPAEKDRQIMVGWCYEDDQNNNLALQRGYQGAFTLFRDLFVKVIRNVNPSSPDLKEEGGSWKAQYEQDGSVSVVTLGQMIVPEITSAYRNHSVVSNPASRTLDAGTLVEAASLTEQSNGDYATNLVLFEKQPEQNYYAINARLDFYGNDNSTLNIALNRTAMVRGGFRVLAGSQEWTDIYYDPAVESLIVERSHSSVIESYGRNAEIAKHRLWEIIDPATNTTRLESLDLTIIIDNSVIEIYANNRTVLTTRVYPWLEASTGVSFLVQGPRSNLSPGKQTVFTTPEASNSKFVPNSVKFSEIELWDGLLNAWPNRPKDTSLPILPSDNLTSILYGLWPET